jgi:hypothetical protein
MTLPGLDLDVAEPVITARAQLRWSLGVHSRDLLVDPGYACLKIKRCRRVVTRHDGLASHLPGFIKLASIRTLSLAIESATDLAARIEQSRFRFDSS